MERALLVGAGGFGECWLPALEELANRVEVVGVVDPDGPTREAVSARLGLGSETCHAQLNPAAVGNATFLIDSSPFVHRSKHAMIGVNHGMHLLMAKPFGRSRAEAERMVTGAERKGLKIGIAQQMRYFPCFLQLRELCQSGDFGRPRHAKVTMRLDGRGWVPGTEWRLELPHVVLMEAAIHHFDLMRWVFGEELTVVSMREDDPPWSPFRQGVNVCGRLLSRSGVLVDYCAEFAPAPGVAFVRFDSGWDVQFDNAELRVRDGAVFGTGLPTGVASAAPVSLERLNREVLLRWLGCLDSHEELAFSGSDNLHSMRLLEQALCLAAGKSA